MNYKGGSFFEGHSLFVIDGETLNILDVNEHTANRYGYSREEFCSMSLRDLGAPRNPADIRDLSVPGDRIWQLTTGDGEQVDVQFTSHRFNYEGKPARMAIAHEITDLIKKEVRNPSRYPKVTNGQPKYPLAEIVWNSDLEVQEWSNRAETIFGWDAGEVVGKENFFKEFVHDAEIEEAYNNIDVTVENQRTEYITEGRVVTSNGEILHSRWFNVLNYDRDGNLDSIRSLITDLSEQKEAKNLFEKLSENSLVGVYLIQNGKFKYVNPRFADLFGYDKEEIINSVSPEMFIHPDERKSVSELLKKRLNGELDSVKTEFKIITKSGETRYVSTYGFTIPFNGEPALAGTMLDITKNKRALRRYRESIKTFRDLFDSVSDAIYIQDEEGRFLEVNKGAEEMYGYSKDEFVGKTPKFLAAPGKVDMEETKLKVKKALEGKPQTFRWWGRRKNGEVFPKEVTVNPGAYFSQDVVIAIGRDISEQHEAEERLRKNEELFRQLFQNSPVPISLLDDRNEVRKINAAFEELFGYSNREMKGLNIDEVIVPDDEKGVAVEVSNEALAGDASSTFGTRITKDGSEVEVMIYGVPVTVEGKTIAIYGIYVDVTDRVHAENELKKSLREKEVLLAEIHHRVKNNLAVITGLLELQSYNTDSPDASDALRESQMRVNSIALIHEKLYQSKNLSEISFDTYLKELVDVIIKSMDTDHTDVEIHIDSDPVELTIGQAIPVGLILNELITNAYKHAFEGRDEGNISIGLKNDDGEISLTVEDDGVGIPKNVSLEKPDSLGIKLVRTLALQLQGEAEIGNSDPGTRFRLHFEIKD